MTEMVMGTPKDQLLHPEEAKKKKGMSREKIAKLEREMEAVERDLGAVDQAYGKPLSHRMGEGGRQAG